MSETAKSRLAEALSALLGLGVGYLTHSLFWGCLVFLVATVGAAIYWVTRKADPNSKQLHEPKPWGTAPVLRGRRPITADPAGIHSGSYPAIPWAHVDGIDLDYDEGGRDGALVLRVEIGEEFAALYEPHVVWIEFGRWQRPERVLRDLRRAWQLQGGPAPEACDH